MVRRIAPTSDSEEEEEDELASDPAQSPVLAGASLSYAAPIAGPSHGYAAGQGNNDEDEEGEEEEEEEEDQLASDDAEFDDQDASMSEDEVLPQSTRSRQVAPPAKYQLYGSGSTSRRASAVAPSPAASTSQPQPAANFKIKSETPFPFLLYSGFL